MEFSRETDIDENRLFVMKPSTIFVSFGVVLLVACAEGETREVVKLPPPRRPAATPPQSQPLVPATPMTAADSAIAFDMSGWTVNVGALDSVAPQLPIPRIVKDFCPGEDCGYPHELIACRQLVLYSTDSTGAAQVGHANARDTITVETGNLHIRAPGRVVFKKDYAITQRFDGEGSPIGPRRDTSARFAAGDTLYLLESEFPGLITWWYRGKLGRGFRFWPRRGAEDSDDGTSAAVQLSETMAVFWYRIKTSTGASGWWKNESLATVGTGSMALNCDFKKGEADTIPEHYR
jgi:hypothetical protein